MLTVGHTTDGHTALAGADIGAIGDGTSAGAMTHGTHGAPRGVGDPVGARHGPGGLLMAGDQDGGQDMCRFIVVRTIPLAATVVVVPAADGPLPHVPEAITQAIPEVIESLEEDIRLLPVPPLTIVVPGGFIIQEPAISIPVPVRTADTLSMATVQPINSLVQAPSTTPVQRAAHTTAIQSITPITRTTADTVLITALLPTALIIPALTVPALPRAHTAAVEVA